MKVFSLAVILFGILYIAAGSPTAKADSDGGEDAEGRGLVGGIVGKFANMAVGAINKVEDMLPGGGNKDKDKVLRKEGAGDAEEEAAAKE